METASSSSKTPSLTISETTLSSKTPSLTISETTLSSKTPSLTMSETTSSSDLGNEVGKKRKKLSIDERLNRNRERNRIHAKKTREKKKNQTAAIHQRIQELYEEGMRLRQIIDAQYTASSLLGLSQSPQQRLTLDNTEASGNNDVTSAPTLLPSSSICDNYYEKVQPTTKRVRRTGKLSPQEREQIRRERNRMHAKKTRDRKKSFMEMSDKIIAEMESETKSLRKYLTEIGLMSKEEYESYLLREMQHQQEMAEARRRGDDEGESLDDEEDEEGETASEAEPDTAKRRMNGPSPSGSSDENEKISSWSRSSQTSSNPGSSSTGQFTEFPSSKSQTSSNTDSAKMSTSTVTSNETQSTHSSLTEKRSGDTNSGSEERDSPNCQQSSSLLNENEWNEGDDERRLRNEVLSEAPESYHHGRKVKLVKSIDPNHHLSLATLQPHNDEMEISTNSEQC